MQNSPEILLRDLVQWGAAQLTCSLSPKVESEQLLSFACNIPRSLLVKRILLGNAQATSTEIAKYKKAIARRKLGYPLQYITGECGFYGHDIRVGPGVLVPRVETEILVQSALAALTCPGADARSVWDLGTGTGCITLALATRVKHLKYVALDKSAAAIKWARRNLENSDNVAVRQADFSSTENLLSLVHEFGQPDVVIANPPYLAYSEIQERHEPYMALYGGSVDGLKLPLAVIRAARKILSNSGLLFMEHAPQQKQTLCTFLDDMGFGDIKSFPDLNNRYRFLSAKLLHKNAK